MDQEQVVATVEKLISLLSISNPKISVDINDQVAIHITVSDAQTGALIGYHGETIASLQLILSIILNQQQKDWQPVSVDIGDYRQRRQQTLEDMASKAADRAKNSGQDVVLTSLPSHERRLIHLYLADNPDVSTRSEGTGRSRHLIISPKSKSK